MQPSGRISSVQLPTLQVLQRHFTPTTISLAQGIPFFPPPEEALSALMDRMGESKPHTYSPDAGLRELREALSLKLKDENGISAPPERIMVTAGANQGFVNAALAIGNPGDEVILLRPYYFNHEMALRMFGMNPVLVDVDGNYQPDTVEIENAINPRTRAVVTVSPNNPTGAVYEKKRLQEINKLCRDHGIYHISDEPYEYFTFGEEGHYSPGAGGGGHTITLHSFSKAFGMPGWRVGYMSYPEELHEHLLKVQDTVVICPSVMGQLLALECLKVGRAYPERFLCVMKEARGVMLGHLRELEDIVQVPETTGGFYFYPTVDSEFSGRELAISLIKESHVAVVPGEPFGSNIEKQGEQGVDRRSDARSTRVSGDGRKGCSLRLSYGNVTPDLAEEGMRRFTNGIREIVG